MHVSYDIVDMHVAMSFTDRMFHFLLDGHARSQGEIAVHCPGCLTEMQVAWIVHGCLRLRVGVAVYYCRQWSNLHIKDGRFWGHSVVVEVVQHN